MPSRKLSVRNGQGHVVRRLTEGTWVHVGDRMNSGWNNADNQGSRCR